MTPPPEGTCNRCNQTRPLFVRKPDHDCIEIIGNVNLIEAARLIAELEDADDYWCTRRIERLDPLKLCVRCCDKDAADEAEYIKERQL